MNDNDGLPQKANIVHALPDGRFIIGVGLPIYTREETEMLHRSIGAELAKIPTAASLPILRKISG